MGLSSPRFKSDPRIRRAAENNPPMSRGETGEAVRVLQQALIDLNFPLPVSIRKHGTPDGIFGRETAGRVRDLQTKHRLSPDRRAGRDTWSALDRLLPNPASPLPPIGVCKLYTHKVRLHLRSIATPKVSEMSALRAAREVYRQYQIRIDFASGQDIALSAKDALTLSVIDGSCKWDQVNDEQRLLYSLGNWQGVGRRDIRVYYVGKIRKPSGKITHGCAGHEKGDPAVVVSAAASKWDMGHEVGHVLLGSSFRPVHSSDTANLMHATSVPVKTPILTPEQVTAMKASPYCIPI